MRKQQNTLQRGVANSLEYIAAKARAWGASNDGANTVTLVPLTPRFEEERHGVYVEALEAGLKLDDRETGVRNIALTGSYGVGKSSILVELRRRYRRRAISISLSSLGFEDDEDAKPRAELESKTNRIQKEIVKQLLYSQDPAKLPGSKYHRVSKFKFWRELGLAVLIAIPVTVAFFLLGWTASLASLFPLPEETSLLPHVIVFVALTLLLLGLRYFTYNRLHISQLTAGEAMIALSPEAATYFDEYLDEIVYFFENVPCDIVIFEDIDRFDDAGIFETLRSLNSILNGARQLRGRSVRFIYAIKDSIFDELGVRAADEELDSSAVSVAERDAAAAEVARANRTKFFDLVIPVVPFITHRSARDLLADALKDLNHSVSPELIDLTARHVADMRLIKNIRNEFAIFKRQIIDEGSLNLTHDGVFAMMLYKSTHLADFERVRYGQSDLDRVYASYRDLVNQNVTRLTSQIGVSRRAMRNLRPSRGKGARFGAAFADRIEQIMRMQSGARIQYQYQGVVVSDEELVTDAFWEKVASTEEAIVVVYRVGYNQQVLQVSRGELESILGEVLHTDKWTQVERTRLASAIAKDTEHRDWLIGAEMSDLMSSFDFPLRNGDESLTFEQVVLRSLRSELAVELVRAGHIDRDYTLYTSTFHAERVSANATNFIIKAVDRHLTDPTFELTPLDVEALLRERPSVLDQRTAYNVSILDYLLANNIGQVDQLIKRLAQGGGEQQDFVDTYLQRGVETELLVSRLVGRWDEIFARIVSIDALDDQRRLRLVGVGLESASDEVDYVLDAPVRDFIGETYGSLEVFTSDTTSAVRADLIAAMVTKSELWLDDLALLGTGVRAAIVQAGAYTVTRTNLLLALSDPEHALDLDSIAATDELVYQHVLEDVGAYIDSLQPNEETATDAEHFAQRVSDVHEADEERIEDFVRRASADCVVDDLTTVPIPTWPVLAKHGGRFPLALGNVAAYIEQYGVDGCLGARLVEAQAVQVVDRDEGEVKVPVAHAILGARQVIPSAEQRAGLVNSLGLEEYLDPNDVPKEAGELVGWLIANQDLEDAASAFTAIQPTDIDGRAYAIGRARTFKSYMSPIEVPATVLMAVLGHADVPEPVKDALIARLDEFTAGGPPGTLSAAAAFALRTGRVVAMDQLLRLASVRGSGSVVIGLLAHHLPTLEWSQICPVLETLGGNYADLCEPNGKHPRFPHDGAHLTLAARLEALGIVSTSGERNGWLVLNMPRH